MSVEVSEMAEQVQSTEGLLRAHAGALEATRSIVAGIGPDQWSASTPCEGWDVRTLVNHIVGGNWWAAELATGHTIADVGDRLDGDVLGSNPLDAYERSAVAARTAFEAPGAMAAPCAVSYGPVPGEVYCGHRFVDVLVHGWDVAVATAQPTHLNDALVDACLEVVRPQAEMLKGSGMFGTEVPVDHADAQTELLAMLGRRA
jgi:uncharacterized protein (TIGR03086 family)